MSAPDLPPSDKPTVPTPPVQTWFDRQPRWLSIGIAGFVLSMLNLTLMIAYQKAGFLAPPPIAVVDNTSPVPSPAAKEFTGETPPPVREYAFGYLADPEERAASFVRLPAAKFRETPAGKIVLGDVPDAFLWEAVRKAAKKSAPWYPNVNQRDVGCCVGTGWKHSADVCQAVQVVTIGGEFKPVSAEVIYGLSRVEIGGGRISGDGSLGPWAREAVRKYGITPMEKFPSADLTEFSPARARDFGRRGVPQDIEDAAKLHPIKGTAQVLSWPDVQRSIAQGYPVAVCSYVGFENQNGSPGTRDAQGFCHARGIWPHCMAFIGIRGGSRPGAFCLNSWGDTAHRGPVWPEGAPPAGFWVDADIVDRMVRDGDSFSLADLAGFPSRNLDWFTKAEPTKPRDVFALLPVDRELARRERHPAIAW